ncbi:ATP-dependent DNA helicase, RecQ family [Rhodopirellula maiorica SM1]|uniref:ATP-dependent DNA helicase RecQ n=2 Tax=Novipirellula TaxID=2795426 RepID=M5RUY2_9BACT|nr:ATP-dependent DNA helicase, RecQ family [Rhodopirellula maiorica SM1]
MPGGKKAERVQTALGVLDELPMLPYNQADDEYPPVLFFSAMPGPAISRSVSSGNNVSGNNVDPTVLLARFGLTQFRPGQRDVVDAVADGHDVMCVMPTGGGKSLCYQLPSLGRPGTTIVVSPLIALMKDQVDTLQSLNIKAKLLNSTLNMSEQVDVMQQMSRGELDLVYVAPERLRNTRFLEAVSTAEVTLLAVDEAHCVSEWGHDFRPDYSRLGRFRDRYLANVQTIALTATATPAVRQDIIDLLRLREPKTFVTGFARTNLRFSVQHSKGDREKDEQLVKYVNQCEGTGIIYAATRKRCEEIASWLPEKTRRPIGAYHAGLDPMQRQRIQDDFMSGKLSAIVATNAFGMGIDKSDIRYVIHYNMPGTLEAYYQEAGRAGRDAKDSDCLMLFSYNDRYIQEFFIENRYPSRETVSKVYEFLLSREEDPIELTLEQVRAAIDVKDGSEAIGTSQTLLAKAGVLKRLDSSANNAIVRIDSNAATMLDFLPREAKVRRRVMMAVEKVVGKRRGEDVYVTVKRLTELANVDRDQLARTLRELRRLKGVDYVPPFRGRAVHLVERDIPFDALEIDFEELERRRQAEHAKLDAVIGFARSNGCRQRVILDYFGDPASKNCGNCDRCNPEGRRANAAVDPAQIAEAFAGVDRDGFVRGVRVVLSGVFRMHARFGKNLVAQMLCGSKNKKLQQWKLHRLSTYGLLSLLKQSEVVAVMDALIERGLLIQREVDDRRPTVDLSDYGSLVMHAKEPINDTLGMKFPLVKRLSAAAKNLEAADVHEKSSATFNEPDADADAAPPSASDDLKSELKDRLKRWRQKSSAALAIPAYRILSNATIDRILDTIPRSTSELEKISGVGPATIEQFGYDIIQLIDTVIAEHDVATQQSTDTNAVVTPASEAIDQDGTLDAEDDPVDPQIEELGNAEHRSEVASSQIASSGSSSRNSSSSDSGSSEKDIHERGDRPIGGRDEPTSDFDASCSQTELFKTEDAEVRQEDAQDHRSPKILELDSAGPLSPDPALMEPSADEAADAYWTWRLFRDGYTVSQVALIRRCPAATLARQLQIAAAVGHPVDPGWLQAARAVKS